ncbi:Protein of uncharacterised function (DUF550) [Bordetella ansorpii]|uniref:Protein of uncharacterized function (DUF550) n=1 Tax=Bordetella ansorpii TaxID=288768 RepID=A0A157RM33_9BORD|nr:dATP/dGTP pyrophosphohydrolase domain-containing protein [Bordetella ansorpii]SAI59060.1 Protein of uncharacterised function (DUF550) [Bordetella ansorpii]
MAISIEFSLPMMNGNVKAAMAAAGAKSADGWKVPRDRIVVMPGFNVRDKDSELYKANVRTIANSIKAEGFYPHKPMSGFVRKREDGTEEICVTDGHTRLDGYDLAVSEGYDGDNKLPMAIHPRGTNLEDMNVGLYKSNTGSPLQPLELAALCKRLIQGGRDEAEVAKRLDLDVGYVRDLLDLIAAPADVRDPIRNGLVAATTARKVLKTHGANAGAVLADGIAKAKSEGKTRATPKHMAKAQKSEQRTPKKEAPTAGQPPEAKQAATSAPVADSSTSSLIALLSAQQAFSLATFGPGPRAASLIAHLRKELWDAETSPDSTEAWIDLVLLGLDGALRSAGGRTPEQVADALVAKLGINKTRVWPDWRSVPDGTPIEHIRENEMPEVQP